MKRIFLFCLLLCFILTACGADDEPKASVQIPGATTKIKVPSVAPEEEDVPIEEEEEDADSDTTDTTTEDDEHHTITKRTSTTTSKKTTTTTAAPEEQLTTMVVTGDNVNVRVGPGTEFKAVTSLNTGDLVLVVDQEGDWYCIDIGGERYYVHGNYLAYPNSSATTTTRKAPTTTRRATTTTRYGDTSINSHSVDPYQLPVANPDKEIYNQPEGSVIDTFGSVGYHTIVAEAKDSRGYTWGQLSTGGWTLVYFDVLPEVKLSLTDGRFETMITINGKGEFTGHSGYYSTMSETGKYYNGASCDFEGTFAITDISDISITLKLTSLTAKAGATMEPYGLLKNEVYTLYLVDVNGKYRLYHEELGYIFYEYNL